MRDNNKEKSIFMLSLFIKIIFLPNTLAMYSVYRENGRKYEWGGTGMSIVTQISRTTVGNWNLFTRGHLM